MGYKIGSDDRLISNLHILGVKALIISVFAIVFSIIFVKLFYWRDKNDNSFLCSNCWNTFGIFYKIIY